MATFDSVIAPTPVTPANTSIANVHTASGDESGIVRATSIVVDTTPIVDILVDPAGGSPFYIVRNAPCPTGERIAEMYQIQVGDIIQGRTSVANAITFSVMGVETT